MSGINLVKEFKKYASSDAFFYVTLDPERALGLEDILPNYTIICPYKSALVDKIRNIHNFRDRESYVRLIVLEEHMRMEEIAKIIKRGTYGILRWCADQADPPIPPRRKGRSNTQNILVLKNSALIENLCKKQGWRLLAPKAKIAEKFENKISQYKALKNIVPYPRSTVATLFKLSGSDPDSYGVRPRKKLVLQFNRGHSGNSTYFIGSAGSPQVNFLDKLIKLYPKREVKISEYINGRTYTLNCLVLSNGEVLTGSISEQITGLKSATKNPNTTCGNDFDSPKKLSAKIIKAIQKIAEDAGKVLYKNKYKGLFGIDVIISLARSRHGTLHKTDTENTNKIYFIELNTHQPASVSFEAKLHRKIGKVPLMAYFILDSLGDVRPACRQGRGPTQHMPPIILPISAKQIIYRNTTNKILKYKDIENKYAKKGLISRMKFIRPNEEIYRKQYL